VAHPMDTLVTAQPELVREQPLLGICFTVPFFEEWMVAFRQGGMMPLWPCTLEVIALRATRFLSNASMDLCLPCVATDWATPLLPAIAGSCEVMWCAIIGCAVPGGSHIGGFGSNRVMLTHSFAYAEWTISIVCSVVHSSLPLMGMTIWTIRACPMHPSFAVWGDVNIAQVSVLSMIPLLLQLWAEPADVWTLLLFGLLTDEMSVLDGCGPYQQAAGLFCCSTSQVEAKSQRVKQDITSVQTVKLVGYRQLLPRMQGQQHRTCGYCKAFLTLDASPGTGL